MEYTVSLPASAADSSVRFGLRIPGWSLGSYTLTVNGKPAVGSLEDGFVYLVVNAGDTLEIALELDMSVKFVRANSRVRSDAGQVAVMRGPLVYCAEQVDNPGDLWNYRLAMASPVRMPLWLSRPTCWVASIPLICRQCASTPTRMTRRCTWMPTNRVRANPRRCAWCRTTRGPTAR